MVSEFGLGQRERFASQGFGLDEVSPETQIRRQHEFDMKHLAGIQKPGGRRQAVHLAEHGQRFVAQAESAVDTLCAQNGQELRRDGRRRLIVGPR